MPVPTDSATIDSCWRLASACAIETDIDITGSLRWHLNFACTRLEDILAFKRGYVHESFPSGNELIAILEATKGPTC
jgi:hypothetical protein